MRVVSQSLLVEFQREKQNVSSPDMSQREEFHCDIYLVVHFCFDSKAERTKAYASQTHEIIR